MKQPNPFAQSEAYWKVIFTIPAAGAGTAEEAFNDSALAVSGFETDEENHIWTFDILYGQKPDMGDVERRLMLMAALHGFAAPKAQLLPVAQQDWLALVARDFPPMRIGRFYVHGSHVTQPVPYGSIPIQVEAGAAFGSGEHGTTSCCLLALEWLARRRRFANMLDMGCGSGILAIAAAKLWKAPVLAVDIDDVAVRVTQENVEINRVTPYVSASVSDGYASAQVKRAVPYDLIVSNILARPLMAFAGDLRASLAPGGVAVLSGLLTSQEAMVRSAHAMQGLRLVRRFTGGEWCTLVLE
jgi:ribosomal protein L11 methyltransferase